MAKVTRLAVVKGDEVRLLWPKDDDERMPIAKERVTKRNQELPEAGKYRVTYETNPKGKLVHKYGKVYTLRGKVGIPVCFIFGRFGFGERIERTIEILE
jgi:hypothetical protein